MEACRVFRGTGVSRNPKVKVVFISTDNVERDESEPVGGPINVSVR